jgi:hypothetical protein
MKSKLSILAAILLFTISAGAQDVRLNAYGSYVFDDGVDSYYDQNSYYNGTIKGGFQWGGGLEYMARPNQGIELLYIGQSTTAPMEYYQDGAKAATFDVNMSYLMLASNRYIKKPQGKVEGYGGLMLGAAFFSVKNPKTSYSGSATKFAWGARLGANIWASEKVGIKLQAQLLSAVQSAGGGLYFGTGGAGAGVSTYSSMYQFSLGGGLVFNLSSHSKPAPVNQLPQPQPVNQVPQPPKQ